VVVFLALRYVALASALGVVASALALEVMALVFALGVVALALALRLLALLTSLGEGRRCTSEAKTRNRLKFAGVPQTRQQISCGGDIAV